ncbi:DUF1127 domain-containing protein [Neorhizobium vignae]|uniref:DUF1127 domain-containing protein n=1 Tax=Neorhizobium vignae TaxID=690585 RepID=UPI000568FBE6|nr:DUF1127 domain-containing protein [Neorhizobium vignae]
MSNTLFNAPQTNSLTRKLVGSLTGSAVFFFRMAYRHFRRARTKRILLSLSEEQLNDAGIDRSLIHTSPEVEVDVRLMSTLMSQR